MKTFWLVVQEVTPYILSLWRSSSWWHRYSASRPPPSTAYFTMLLVRKDLLPGISSDSFSQVDFRNSVMGERIRVLVVVVAITNLLSLMDAIYVFGN